MVVKLKNPLSIFCEAIGLYFAHVGDFIKYMTFPVLGQLCGFVLIFFLSSIYIKNLPSVVEKFPEISNIYVFIALTLLVLLPGLAVFFKAFWEYIVAYGAVNSMCENMKKSGRVYDFDAHTEVIKRKSFKFATLWLFLGGISILAICPLFLLICLILLIYFVLAFQVFTFEVDLTPLGCLKRSFSLIKGHFSSTFMLLALVGALMYVLFPQVVIKIFEMSGINNSISSLVLPIVNQLSIPDLSKYGLKSISNNDISLFIVKTSIAQIIIAYTLPMRSIMWTLWYNNLNKGSYQQSDNCIGKNTKKRKATSSKRPSEKLMENSHKKFVSKKLDKNIIKRASEKDD